MILRASHLPFVSAVTRSRKLHAGVSALDDLALQIKPRYHFAVGEKTFFQREPYRNPISAEDEEKNSFIGVTRFVGLADFSGNIDKERVCTMC